MGSQVVNFAESTSRTRSQTVTIPNIYSVVSTTINTGNVTTSIAGNELTVNVSNGTSTRSTSYTPSTTATDYRTGGYNAGFPSTVSYNSGGYSGTLSQSGSRYLISGSAADSKTVSQSGTTTATNTWTWSGSSWVKYSTSYSPSSVSYNDGTYSGTLPLQSTSAGAPTPSGSGAYNGQQTTTSGSPGSATFSGTVSKPDDRVYRQDYSGTVYGSTQYTYYYAYDVTINYSVFPSMSVVVQGMDALNNGSILPTDKSDIILGITPNDDDTSDSLQYSVLLRGIEKQPFTPTTKGSLTNYTIGHSDLILGNNLVTIKVKDSNGAETSFNYTIRNKVPQTLSLLSVKNSEQALGYLNAEFDDLNDIKPSGYTGKMSLAEIINFLS